MSHGVRTRFQLNSDRRLLAAPNDLLCEQGLLRYCVVPAESLQSWILPPNQSVFEIIRRRPKNIASMENAPGPSSPRDAIAKSANTT